MSSLQNLAEYAKAQGCSKAQIRAFLKAGYIPQKKQVEFHAAARLASAPGEVEYIGYGGTRGQAKSHAVLAQSVVDDMARIDNLKFLYLRKVGRRASESFEDLRIKVLSRFDHQYKNKTLYLPNGSFMIIGGFRSESDVDDYLGIEYDGMIIEDATMLSESKITKIFGSLRTAKEGWNPVAYLSANPGGVGHAVFKKMFVDPWMQKRETITRFIHTVMGDNRFINAAYERYLNSLTGWLRRAWRDGDFSIAAGQYFTVFNLLKHVIDPIEIMPHWNCWIAKDFGNSHWNTTGLFSMDSFGKRYMIDECSTRRVGIKEDSETIKKMLARNNVSISRLSAQVIGSDAFQKKADESRGDISIADLYKKYGFYFKPANMDRIGGALNLIELFTEDNLILSRKCTKTIQQIPEMVHDPDRGEDVLKTDCHPETGEGGDDFYDMLRYGMASYTTSPYGVKQLKSQDRFS